MSLADSRRLQVGEWAVDPDTCAMTRGAETVRLEARAMRLLLTLAERPGRTVSLEDLLETVWTGVTVNPDSVYQAVAGLRRQLGDSPRHPRYIVTVPRRGYRLIAEVGPWRDDAPPPTHPPRRRPAILAALAVLILLIGAATLLAVGARRGLQHPPPSVGVLPFLDLTISMDQEVLADDVTEGVADRLSRNPALRSPGFRTSIDLKLHGKEPPPAEAARRLGVDYLVDGSVRKSGAQVRVSARLIRADSGLVLWTRTYDEPLDHVSAAQDAVADAVAASLAGRTG